MSSKAPWLLLLLLLPTAHAAAPPGVTVARETDVIGYDAERLSVFLLLEYRVTDPAAYASNATWRFYTPLGVPEPSVKLRRENAESPVDPARVNASGTAGAFAAWAIDLRANLGSLQTNENHTLSLSFNVQAMSVRFKAAAGLPQLVVYVENAGDRPILGERLSSFVPAGARQHATATNMADGTEYAVTILASPSAPGRDMNPYLWGVGGLVLGFALALLWMRRSPKAKKFEKGGAMESRSVLEARRRTLMAALKELEVAHEAKEVPDEAYAPLKEEYKAQAVRVMRSLEEKKEPGQG